MHLLTVLLRLRQICLDPGLIGDFGSQAGSVKARWLESLLEGVSVEGRKVLVFGQFAGYLRKLKDGLSGRDLQVFQFP